MIIKMANYTGYILNMIQAGLLTTHTTIKTENGTGYILPIIAMVLLVVYPATKME